MVKVANGTYSSSPPRWAALDMVQLCTTLDAVADVSIDSLVCAGKRKRGRVAEPKPAPLRMRWPVERTNSWLSNYGQLQRNTDRSFMHRLAAMAFTKHPFDTSHLDDLSDRRRVSKNLKVGSATLLGSSRDV